MIITATVRSQEPDDFGTLVTLHLAGDPELARKTAEQLPQLVPLVSALADGQTDLGELALVCAELVPDARKDVAVRVTAVLAELRQALQDGRVTWTEAIHVLGSAL